LLGSISSAKPVRPPISEILSLRLAGAPHGRRGFLRLYRLLRRSIVSIAKVVAVNHRVQSKQKQSQDRMGMGSMIEEDDRL